MPEVLSRAQSRLFRSREGPLTLQHMYIPCRSFQGERSPKRQGKGPWPWASTCICTSAAICLQGATGHHAAA